MASTDPLFKKLMTAVFSFLMILGTFLSVGHAHAQSESLDRGKPDDLITAKIGQVWLDSQALQTFVGLATLASTDGDYANIGMTRRQALRRARRAAANLDRGLKELAILKETASADQKHAIDGLELVAHTRIRAINALFTIGEDEGFDALVTSCVGWWECWGFETACIAAGGKWEPWGAGTETCTTK